MIHKVLTHPNPLLRRKAKPITVFDDSLRDFCKEMFDTMYAHGGLGLAAMQIGDERALFVLDLSVLDDSFDLKPEERRLWICANPLITPLEKTLRTHHEGCLSLPGISADIERPEKIRLRYQDETGAPHELESNNFLAICTQHEYDHLQGKLYIDHLPQRLRDKVLKDYDPNYEPDYESSAAPRGEH